ncbi:Glycosyltransferase involved in cell wall bisynthesis [Loktanella sp. DSM 29012]|nr:Glycosyltransferase involved in cell wall bisynthesis [Loktanella sp. DSM 29012]
MPQRTGSISLTDPADIGFSVVIPSYNRRDYLMACLDSVAAQTHAPAQVIVVDDGSTDGTLAALADRPGVQVLTQANAGPGAARNAGAAQATGTYLAFLDSDDLWVPDSLRTFASLIVAHDHPALLFARFADFTGTPPPHQGAPAAGEAYADFLAGAGAGHFAGAGMMVIRRDAFDAAGGFTTAHINAEDHDLALRLGTARGFVQVTAPVTLLHRLHDSNEMGDAARNTAGIARLVAQEAAGRYPGGTARRGQRRRILLGHVRAAVLAGVRQGDTAALRLYLRTLPWALAAGRWRYLLAVPALTLGQAMRRMTGRVTP